MCVSRLDGYDCSIAGHHKFVILHETHIAVSQVAVHLITWLVVIASYSWSHEDTNESRVSRSLCVSLIMNSQQINEHVQLHV